MNKLLTDYIDYICNVMKCYYESSEKHIQYSRSLLFQIGKSLSELKDDGNNLTECIKDYLSSIEKNKDSYGQSNYYALKRLCHLLDHVANSKDITIWKYEKHYTKYPVNDKNNDIINSYLISLSKQLHFNTIYNHKIIIKKFMHYLETVKNKKIENIVQGDLYDYFCYLRVKCNQDLIKNIYIMKAFVNFLVNEGINTHLNSIFLSKPVSSPQKNYSYFTHDELEKILHVVDRSTDLGKRDYAILSLAISSGLRSVDIATLKLKDIDWNRKRITITQNKTKKTVILPLSKDTGDAIIDYIINSRPETDSQYIFIRSRRPYKEINRKGTIQNIFFKYRSLADVEHKINDGRTMHGIRRSVAYHLVNSDIDVHTVSQILGHSDINSTKIYASVHTENLKKCALHLSSFPIKGGYYHDE